MIVWYIFDDVCDDSFLLQAHHREILICYQKLQSWMFRTKKRMIWEQIFQGKKCVKRARERDGGRSKRLVLNEGCLLTISLLSNYYDQGIDVFLITTLDPWSSVVLLLFSGQVVFTFTNIIPTRKKKRKDRKEEIVIPWYIWMWRYVIFSSNIWSRVINHPVKIYIYTREYDYWLLIFHHQEPLDTSSLFREKRERETINLRSLLSFFLYISSWIKCAKNWSRYSLSLSRDMQEERERERELLHGLPVILTFWKRWKMKNILVQRHHFMSLYSKYWSLYEREREGEKKNGKEFRWHDREWERMKDEVCLFHLSKRTWHRVSLSLSFLSIPASMFMTFNSYSFFSIHSKGLSEAAVISITRRTVQRTVLQQHVM